MTALSDFLRQTDSTLQSAVNGLARLLRAERDGATDATGTTALIQIAEDLVKLQPSSTDRRTIEAAVAHLPLHDVELELEDVQRLAHFIHFAEIPLAAFKEAYLEMLQGKRLSTGKRAEIMRLLVECGHRFTRATLYRENILRRDYPWIWIDCMVPTDWSEAALATTELLKRTGNAQALRARLPYWWDVRGEKLKEDVAVWLHALPAPERKIVRAWTTSRMNYTDDPQPGSAISGTEWVKGHYRPVLTLEVTPV